MKELINELKINNLDDNLFFKEKLVFSKRMAFSTENSKSANLWFHRNTQNTRY